MRSMSDDIRSLPYYLIPSDWNIHLIDQRTNEQQLEQIQRIIENARLLAFDTETMPSFYHSNFQQNYKRRNGTWHSTPCETQETSCISKPSLLQVAVRHQSRSGKNVLLFDLQELFDRSNRYYQEGHTTPRIHDLIQLVFNHPDAYKLSQSLLNDLAHLKCSYNETCFQTAILHHLIELSDMYRKVFPDEKDQQIYSLQRMTAMTLHCQLDKRQQCANWSKRPLTQALKDYAAMDVIVMIDIYDRLKTRIKQELIDPENQLSIWESFQASIKISLDLTEIVLYQCICGERFISNKTRNKHARTCPYEQQRLKEAVAIAEKTCQQKKKVKKQSRNDSDPIKPKLTNIPSLSELDLYVPASCGRGYIPPALKRAYQSMNHISLYEHVRCSSSLDELNQFNENRPPDAQFFLDDDDTEVAQAFGLEITNRSKKSKECNGRNQIQSNVSSAPIPKQNLKIASYPPKKNSSMSSENDKRKTSDIYLVSLNFPKSLLNEKDLLDRLKDDFDSQPEFHCHLFGLGGRGRSSSTYLPPPAPYLNRHYDDTE